MTTLELLGHKYTFRILRSLDVGRPVPFTELHGSVGATSRMMSHTLKLCLKHGLVESIGPRAPYKLTDHGETVLRLAEPIVAFDGEPHDGEWVLSGEPGHGLPDDPFAKHADAFARVAVQIATGERTAPGERIVDTSEFAKNEEVEW